MLFTAVFLFISFLINLFFYEGPKPELNVTGTSQKSFFGENAFAFLYGVPLLDEDETPFNLQQPFPKIRQRPPNQPKNPPTQIKKPPPPPPPPEGDIIQYNGWMNVATGGKTAFVKVIDLRSKKLVKSDTIQIGETIKNYKISNIDEEKIVIEDADGNSQTIQIYKQITIMKK